MDIKFDGDEEKHEEAPAEIVEEQVTHVPEEVENPAEITGSSPAAIPEAESRKKSGFAHLLKTKKRKVIAIIIAVILIFVILFAIPFTRYGLLGLVVKKEVTITVVDSKSKKPVSNALVKIGSTSKQTDKNGVVKFDTVSVGQPGVEVTKQYYQTYDHSYTIPVLANPESPTYEVVATGRRVAINIVDKITGKPLEDAVISSSQTKATTNADGKTDLILSPKNELQDATLTKSGYNSQDVKVMVTDGAVNTYMLTPYGTIFYLSKATGTINVMKSNLDGTNPVVFAAGTGQEDNNTTSLLAARDWKYAALLTTRENDQQGLYLVDGTKGDFTIIDQGNATFSSIGWSGHNFVYIVYRNAGNYWDDKRQAIKSFNADTRKITTIDETSGSGTSTYDAQYQSFSNVYILGNEVVYAKSWSYGYYNNLGEDKTTLLISADPNGGTKRTVKSFAVNLSVSLKLYEPTALYLRVTTTGNDPSVFYEYEGGTVKMVSDTSDAKFNEAYTTFLVSPSGKKTLWYEPRDGKNTLFIGDENGKNAQNIANLSDYTPYGWYGDSDQYILLSKNNSELYIASVDGAMTTSLKITDYHKGTSYIGYGSGYGGL
ncbi:MAG: hypothetical protein JWN12_423 [Candidatus Saccharibacteria bacterium]|nr:hypothetical protein [Candidatus Saccharibacteria bacterium]